MKNIKTFANKKYMKHDCHVCDLPLMCQTNKMGEVVFPLECPACNTKVYHRKLVELLIQKIDITELSTFKKWWRYKRKGFFISKEFTE
jgi:hypothetical protein